MGTQLAQIHHDLIAIAVAMWMLMLVQLVRWMTRR